MGRAADREDELATSVAEQPSKDVISPTPTSASRSSTTNAWVAINPMAMGKYTLLSKLGHGGMAEVFLAVARGMAGFQKLTVIKRIHPQLLEEERFVNMFMDEARLAARLNHPNVVQTYEVDEVEGHPFIAMEYMDGQSFDKVLKALRKKKVKLAPEYAVYVISQCLAALDYAYNAEDFDGTPMHVVHRDISPSNVFVSYQGAVKILDFGIAKASTQVRVTRTGEIKGKYAYMSPEQSQAKQLDGRADVWSLGVVLWECLAGRRLFRGQSDLEVIKKVIAGDVIDLKTVAPDVPEELHRITHKALAADRDERYDAAAMRKDLEAWMSSEGHRHSPSDFGQLVSSLFPGMADARKEQLKIVLDGLKDGSIKPNKLTTGSFDVTATMQGTPSGIVASSASRVEPPASSGFRKEWLIAGAALIAAGLAIWQASGGSGSDEPATTPAAPPQAAAQEAPEPSAPAAAEKVKIRIEATPRTAHLFLDGVRLLDNPHVAEIDKSQKRMQLLVEAPGYERDIRPLVPDADLNVSVALRAIPTQETSAAAAPRRRWGPRRRRPQAAADTPAQKTKEPAETGGTGPKLDLPRLPARKQRSVKLDTTNPWD